MVSKLSPLNDTLDLCVKYVDNTNIGGLSSRALISLRIERAFDDLLSQSFVT